MNTCSKCQITTNEAKCPRCKEVILSVPEDTMDRMIQDASVPNLASMFKRGQKAGYIQPIQTYTATA